MKTYPGLRLVCREGKESDYWKYFQYSSSGTGITIDTGTPVQENQNNFTMGLKIISSIAHFEIERHPIHLGNLDKDSKDQGYHIPVREWVEHEQKTAAGELLYYAPYWIEQLAMCPKDTAGLKRFGIGRTLLVYRLTEICLRVIEQWEGDKTRFMHTQALLVRQRYRYLLGLWWLRQKGQRISTVMHDLHAVIRRARSEYASLLLENSDRIELALHEAVPFSLDELPEGPLQPDPHNGWDLDQEIGLLMYEFDLEKTPAASTGWLLSFAWEYLSDQILTDQLVRRWMLARDDLPGATRLISSVLLTRGGQKKLEWLYRLIASSFRMLHWFVIVSAALGLASLYFQSSGLLISAGVVGLLFPGLTLLLTGWLGEFPWSTQVLYPLALRVPAMGMVGILAATSLADAYVNFAFSAFSPAHYQALGLILAGSLIPSFLYIKFEVDSRRISRKPALSRSVFIFLYCSACSLWLGFAMGWLAAPMGLMQLKDISAPFLMVFSQPVSFSYVLIISVMALLVGVFTQIFWEDKSISEPI